MKFKKCCSSYRLQASFLGLMVLSAHIAFSQSMGISNTAITPDASSILEMRTTTKGLLIPRLTTTERNNITSPATGLMIYNTTTNAFNFYNGSGWAAIATGSSVVNSVTGTNNRITIGGTSSDPTVDISSSYVGQSSITTLGTIGTGTWNGSIITSGYGGTGNGFTKFTGATTSEKTYTLPDVSTTILTKNYTGALATGIVKNTNTTGELTIAVPADFPTLNQNTTGSAATLTTPRSIHGGSFNGSGDVTNIIASTYGGTGNGFTKFTGPTTSEKTFTLPNANATILTDNTVVTPAQGGTGISSYAVGDLLYASGTTTLSTVGAGSAGQVLKSNGAAAPTWENGVTIITLGSDVVNNNAVANTLADVTGLSFSVVAGVTYRFKAVIIYNAAATGTGSRWTINGPASPTMLAYTSQYSLTATTSTIINANAYNLPAAANASSTFTTGNIAMIEGIITPSANGTLVVRFASEIANSAITAKAGSTIHWW